ncbi:MAG: response regulator [Nitrospinota bacterium]|nr:response regulator [Nitrospinota bacterium]
MDDDIAKDLKGESDPAANKGGKLEYAAILKEYFRLKNETRQLHSRIEEGYSRAALMESALKADGLPLALMSKERKLLMASRSLDSALGGEKGIENALLRLRSQINEAELVGRPVTFHIPPGTGAGEPRLTGVITPLGSGVSHGGFMARFSGIGEESPSEKSGAVDKPMETRMMETIHLMQAAFISDAPAGQLFKSLLDKLLGLTQSEFGFVGRVLYTPGGTPYMKTHAISDISWNETTRGLFRKISTEGMEFRNLNTLFGYTLKTGEAVISNDPESDKRAGGLPEGHPKLANYLGVPFTLGGKIVGMAGLANRPGGYDEELVAHLRPLLATCASLLDGYESKEQRRRAEERLVQARMTAEKATRDKDKYISLIAHDLKSPFTSIIAFLKLLGKGKVSLLEPDNRPLFDSIIESSERATKMINEVLSLSRLGIGAVKLATSFQDASTTADSAISLLGSIAQVKKVGIVNNIPPGTRVYADSILFGEVLSNILSNAIKFTHRGGEVVFFIPQGQPTTVAIRDNGVGIDDDTLPNIFRHDVKTSQEGTDGERGTGLALPLCREIMRAHGGDLSVESTKGKGSVFYARLPEKRPIILVVDDERLARREIRRLLEPLGAEIVEAKSATEAISLAISRAPDLICLDLNMPDVDGFEALDTLKRAPETKSSPVIIITSDPRMESRERAIRKGSDDFITKESLTKELLPRVRKFIR